MGKQSRIDVNRQVTGVVAVVVIVVIVVHVVVWEIVMGHANLLDQGGVVGQVAGVELASKKSGGRVGRAGQEVVDDQGIAAGHLVGEPVQLATEVLGRPHVVDQHAVARLWLLSPVPGLQSRPQSGVMAVSRQSHGPAQAEMRLDCDGERGMRVEPAAAVELDARGWQAGGVDAQHARL